MRLVEKEYWEQVAADAGNYIGYQLPFHDLFMKLLPKGGQYSFIEVGCAPGRNLSYFHKHFGYRPFGVDYIRNFDVVKGLLAQHGLPQAVLYNADLFEFNPPERFDIVGSFGFIEHFTEWKEAIHRIVALAKPGGYVVTTIPYFRRGQYLLRRLLTPEAFERHNLDMMDLEKLKQAHQQEGVELIYADYFNIFDFWGNEPKGVIKRLLFKFVMKVARFFEKYPVNLPNRFFSPHIVLIGKRQAAPAVEK
jgi:SAM-dependent methyltransferase